MVWGDAIDSQVTGGSGVWLVGGISVHFWREQVSPNWLVSRVGDCVGPSRSLVHVETWEQHLRVWGAFGAAEEWL